MINSPIFLLHPRRWPALLMPLLMLLGSQAHAMIVHQSCVMAPYTATAWEYLPRPAGKPTPGSILARRVLIANYRYSNKGTLIKPELIAGAAWTPNPTFNRTHHTVDVNGLPGAGVRIAPLRYYGDYIGDGDMNYRTEIIVENQGVSLPLPVFYMQELVLTDPDKFKGGKADSVTGYLLLGMMSRFTHTYPQSDPRCNVANLLHGNEILSIGGSAPVLTPIQQPTCSASSGNLNFSVNLPAVNMSELSQAGSLSKGTAFALQLNDCNAGARPYITFTDANDRGNRGNSLSLSGDSQASGVAIRLMDGNRAITFGPEHSSVNAGNTGQFAMGSASQNGQSILLPLQAHYVRTNSSLKPGTLRAAAIVTIAYP